ncbi:MAG: hypothetical protein KAV69_04180, partial [Deltaproteobacteria bacterium]|nr:hypothetical protein [Deltaproteobacteria bacterium]
MEGRRLKEDRWKAEGGKLSVIFSTHISRLRSFRLLLFLVSFLSFFPFSLLPSTFHLSCASEPDYGDAIVLG